ncbi:MAG: hypothetical protein IE913_00025 [Halothiobacillus sp.]|nr:hypothetical protein [Halothiobacillus sp.]
MIAFFVRIRTWTSTKFALISLLAGLAATFAAWLFPDSGKKLVDQITSPNISMLPIPGDNTIEKQLSIAKMHGVGLNTISTEFALAIIFARPSLTGTPADSDYGGNIVALSNASSLRSTNQDLVFSPGRCRFIGKLHLTQPSEARGRVFITTMSCLLDNGDAYGLGEFDGPSIGFLTVEEKPMSSEVELIEEKGGLTLPLSTRFLVRFNAPLSDITYNGKSSDRW